MWGSLDLLPITREGGVWTVGWGSLDLLPIWEGCGQWGGVRWTCSQYGKGVDSGVGFAGPAPNNSIG